MKKQVKKFSELKIIRGTNDNLQKEQELGHIEVLSQFYNEELVEIPTAQGVRSHIAKTPYFLIGKDHEDTVAGLKKELSIGKDNFPEYDRL
jgi:hypothetical protein